MFDLDAEMKMTFLEEAQGLLDSTEAAFIALDEGDRSPDLIDRIFRLAHNFKSSAKTVGLNELSDFGHVFEDVLTQIKSGTLAPDKFVCTILLKTLDHFKLYVAGLKSDMSYIHDTSEIMKTLEDLKAKEAKPESASQYSQYPPQPEPSEPLETSKISESHPRSQPIASAPSSSFSAPHSSPRETMRPSQTSSLKPAEDESLRVNRHKLDELLNLIGELVVNQSMMVGHRTNETLQSDHSIEVLGYIEKLVYEIQRLSISLRMTPIAPLFQKVKRIARDASESLSKTISFVSEGEHVEVDKIILERISDPLNHLVRNAVDHGIETDDERLGKKKSEKAKILLKAEQEDDRIILTLSDNGRGMDSAKLIAKAIEKGLISSAATLSEAESYDLIFKPGFSTKENITDISGRGVGMDVVQRAIEDLKGSIQIQTQLGEGTRFVISLPLSLSILTGMVVGVDDRKYVIPVSQLVETVDLNHFRIETSTGHGRMFNLRGEIIPIYSLSEILHQTPLRSRDQTSENRGPGLLVLHNGKKISFQIDHIFGQQQIVLKKLGNEMRELPGVIAGAILSTGEPGLVLSLNDFVRKGVSYAS